MLVPVNEHNQAHGITTQRRQTDQRQAPQGPGAGAQLDTICASRNERLRIARRGATARVQR